MRLVKTDLRGLNATDVLLRARGTLRAMTNNPVFPHPIPSMADFGAACAALEQSIIKTMDGASRQEYSQKQERLLAVKDMMRSLASYVDAAAQGDIRIILSAGFEERRRSTRITSMDAPRDVRARTGTHNGTIIIRWKPVRGARMYQLFICKGDERVAQNWTPLDLTSNSRYEATGLDALTYYSFRLCAIGASVQSPMSQAATALSIGIKAA